MSYNPEDFERAHIRNIKTYSHRVKAAYSKVIDKVVKLKQKAKLNALDEFFFYNNPELQKSVNVLLEELYTNIYGIVTLGINTEWELANERNDALTKMIFGKKLSKIPDLVKRELFSTNEVARQAFVSRKIKGLGLSDRVWKLTKQFKQELELALEVGISQGQSAASLASEIKRYLNEPDKLFRKVLDKKTGKYRLSKAAQAYHPGQGVYRSSYKNALRLTAHETNAAYEKSKLEKRKKQSFVAAIEIKVSPQHKASDDKNGISCLSLQGLYPKTFDFSDRWHVKCKCMSLEVLKSDEEIDHDIDLILEGREPEEGSVNQVLSNPAVFNDYVIQNQKKWQNWKNKPRFLINFAK